MKGWGHFSISLIIIFLSFLLLMNQIDLHKLSNPGFFIFISIFLFLLGSLLPDSDSNNKGSLIFVFVPAVSKKKHKETDKQIGQIILIILGIIMFPIALITNQLEKIIMKYTKRKRGHRESLHTLFGIIIISLFWGIIFNILFFCITKSQDYFLIPIFPILLFFSQFLHLLEDLQKDWKIKWK